MKAFLVERDVGAAPMLDITGMAATSQRHAAAMRVEGDGIFYLGSTYIPEDGRCLCLFQARNADVVAEHSGAAHLPVLRIVDAVPIGLPPVPGSA